MIVCTHCQAKNSVDSAFCKSCGREVVEADREAARQENSKLIAEGYSLLAEGRTEEAELVARAALEADANAGAAYSLLGMCYERADDIVAALECYERVVELNPDSALDKIKVTQLRNVLSRRVEEDPAPNRKFALAGAVACVFLVVAIGGIAAVLTRPVDAEAKTKVEKPNLLANNGEGFGQVPTDLQKVPQGTTMTNPQTDPNQVQDQQDPQLQQGNVGNGGNNNGNSNGNSNRYSNQPALRNNDNPGLSNIDPQATGDNGTGDPWAPVQPDVKIAPRVEDPPPTGNNNGGTTSKPGGEDPPPVTNPGEKPGPAKAQGTISITKSTNNSRSNGGGGVNIGEEDGKSGNGLQVLVRTGNQQMLTQKYDQAAKTYEQARRSGGDNGAISKKLAICYEKMGKKGEAIQEYRNAKRHLESKAASDPTAKSQLESVNQALKNLGG